MLKDNDVIASVAVKNLDESAKFYETVLGLEKFMVSPGGIYFKSGNTGVFVYPSEFAGTNKATSASWNVESVEDVVKDLKTRGVEFEHYDNIPGAKVEGDIHVMGGMKAAWFKDPDGNILNIVNQMAA